MSLSRRDFMKLVGVSVASLALARCRPFIGPTCYVPLPPPTPTNEPASALERLRLYWTRFDELAQAAIEESNQGGLDNTFGQELIARHRLALDELVAGGGLTAPVADLVQEAYEAAVFHVWRSNIPATCYEPVMVDYAPASASSLVHQAAVLEEIAGQGTVDPSTLDKARAALEHDMAFYALSEAEVQSLYDRIIAEWQEQGQATPDFQQVELEITPEAEAAARFIISLLTGQ